MDKHKIYPFPLPVCTQNLQFCDDSVFVFIKRVNQRNVIWDFVFFVLWSINFSVFMTPCFITLLLKSLISDKHPLHAASFMWAF